MKEKDKVFCVDQGGGKSQVNVTENQSPTLTTTHGGEPVVCLEGNGSRESHLGDGYKESDIMYTLNTVEQHAVCYGIDQQGGKGMAGYGIDVSPTLAAESHGTPHAVCYGISAYDSNAMKSDNPPPCVYGVDTYNQTQSKEQAKTLNSAATDSDHIPCTYKGDTNMSNNAVVRRLTPRECERLQGMPDGWCDIGEWVDENGKKHKDADAPKYKALGNGIALPFWQWLAYRITDQLKTDGVENPTLFSMFDGIGSFCLAFKRAGCEPVAVSEIEPYPIAVCKKHFGDEDLGITGDIDKYV